MSNFLKIYIPRSVIFKLVFKNQVEGQFGVYYRVRKITITKNPHFLKFKKDLTLNFHRDCGKKS